MKETKTVYLLCGEWSSEQGMKEYDGLVEVPDKHSFYLNK